MNSKTKTRRRGRAFAKKTMRSLPPTASKGNRYSPFGSLVSDGSALRELEGEALISRYLASYEGGLQTINAYFSAIETEFLAEREDAAINPDAIHAPDYYDEVLLNICRRDAARHLLVRARSVFHRFIKLRMQLPMGLPETPKRPLTELETKIEQRLKECESVA